MASAGGIDFDDTDGKEMPDVRVVGWAEECIPVVEVELHRYADRIFVEDGRFLSFPELQGRGFGFFCLVARATNGLLRSP